MQGLFRRFAGRYALTVLLVAVEAAAWVLFPLVIGRAIDGVLGLVGTVVILSTLNTPIFIGSLIVTAATVTLYALTGRLTTRYNAGLNDEQERRVDIVHSGNPARVARHLRRTMRWNSACVRSPAGSRRRA